MLQPATLKCIQWALFCVMEVMNKKRNIYLGLRRELRLQAFGVTEPTAGTDTTSLTTTAVKTDDGYLINGQKIWTSRAEHSDLMVLLARTTPKEKVTKKSQGLSVFLIDMNEAKKNGMTIQPIRTMLNHSTTQIFFDNVPIPDSALVGEEGKGFKYILSGMNAERILIAAECIGDARWFINKATQYSKKKYSEDLSVKIKEYNSQLLVHLQKLRQRKRF